MSDITKCACCGDVGVKTLLREMNRQVRMFNARKDFEAAAAATMMVARIQILMHEIGHPIFLGDTETWA